MPATEPPSGSLAGAARPDGVPAPLDRRTVVIASVVIIGAVMSILDATVVNVALETLGRHFHSSLADIQWVISGYTLALASAIPVSGWLADRFGARQVWLAAIIVFAGGSMLCGFAWSSASLIGFRVLQGVGGGVLTPVGTIIIARAAGPDRMGRVMALMGVPILVGPVLGPVVGGLLIQSASWRWIFFINLPISALALILGRRLLPVTPAQANQRLDIAGLALLSPGLALLIYGISRLRSLHELGSAAVLISGVSGLALIVVFVVRSLRIDSPLMEVRFFRGRTFAASAITTFVLAVAAFGTMLMLPLYFQQVRGESVLLTGLLTTPQAVGMAVGMTLTGRMSDRVGAGWVVPVGLTLMAGALVGLTRLSSTTSYWAIGAVLIVLGAGLGASMMPTMAAAYATVSSEAVSRATTELQIVQRIGSTFGAALFAVILEQRISTHLPRTGGLAVAQHASAARPLAVAFAGTFWWGIALTTVALVPAYFLPRWRQRGAAGTADAQPPPDSSPRRLLAAEGPNSSQ